MNLVRIGLAAAILALAAACAPSPEQRIVNSCVSEGGNTRETCTCFADNLKQNLTAEQLAVVADAVGSDDAAAQQRMQEQLGMNGMVAVMGAAKSCNMTN